MSRQPRSFVPRVVLALACLTLAALAAARLELHFVDVGHGDALLIRTPDGHTIVYDGGPSETALLDYLQRNGIDTIDIVIASHAAETHITGLPAVIETFAPTTYLDNGLPATGATYERLMTAVAASGAEALGPGPHQIELGDVTLHVLPVPGRAAWGQADNSLGLVIEYGRFRASLLGNAGPALQAWLIDETPDTLTPVQVHKASAHASANGDTTDMLARLRPEAVVVSVGTETPDSPDPTVLARYDAEGTTRVSRTDTDGTVTIVAWSDGTYNLRPSRRTTPTAAAHASHLSTVGLPFNVSDVRIGWVRRGNAWALEVRFLVQSATGDSLRGVSFRAEFFVADAQGRTRRLGGTGASVGVGIPLPAGTYQAVNLSPGFRFDNHSLPGGARVDLYVQTARGWRQLDSFHFGHPEQ